MGGARIEFEIGANVAGGASELKKLSGYIDELNGKLNEAREAGDWDSSDRFNTYIHNVESRITDIQKAQKLLDNTRDRDETKRESERRTSFGQVLNVGKSAGSTIGAAGNGDVAGTLQGAGSTASMLGGAGKALLSNPATALIAAAVGAAWAGNKASQVWENEALNVAEAGTVLNESKFRQSSAERTLTQRGYFARAAAARDGTNTTTADFLRLESQLAKTSNYKNAGDVEKDAQAVNYASFNTGASKEQLLQLAGAQNLYGYKGAEAIQSAYEGLKRSGMTDARFDEFLSGIQRVMEEGIEKGFVGSADTVARNLAMISSLSGSNEFWTGENGARQISRINSGFAGAVDLSSTTDMMMYAAAKGLGDETMRKALGKDYAEGNRELNARMVMEQGISGQAGMEMLRNYARILNENSPDDEFKLGNIRQSFGLNVTGARQMMQILDRLANSKDGAKLPTKDDIQNIVNDSQNKTAESNYYDNVQKIHDIMAKVGQGFFDVKAVVTNELAKDVNGIYNFLTKPNSENGSGAKNLAGEIASSEKAKKDIQEKVDDYSKKVRIEDSSSDKEVENRLNSSLVSSAAEETGHELEAVKSYIAGENGITLAANSNINLQRNIFGKLQAKDFGDDSLDDIAMKQMFPYLKNKRLFSEISDVDIADFLSKYGEDKDIHNAYSKVEESATPDERKKNIEAFTSLWNQKLSGYFGDLPSEETREKQAEMSSGYNKMLEKFAAGGGGLKKHGFFGKRIIDNVVTEDEKEALQKAQTNDSQLIKAYRGGDTEAYFSRLEQILVKLFGEIHVENAG